LAGSIFQGTRYLASLVIPTIVTCTQYLSNGRGNVSLHVMIMMYEFDKRHMYVTVDYSNRNAIQSDHQMLLPVRQRVGNSMRMSP
jgi:hypothetical protein